MVSAETGLPASFSTGDDTTDPPAPPSNVKWVAPLGSGTFGTPVVANGRVYIGTTNGPAVRTQEHPGEGGLLLCLDEATGKEIWQFFSPRRRDIISFDHHSTGTCSTPTVDGDRVYLVTNRDEVVCLSTTPLTGKNEGSFTDEAQYYAGPGKPPVKLKPTDADILWYYDMATEVDVVPHDASCSSCLILGDYLYVCTANGCGWEEQKPNPKAPNLIVLNKRTGKLVARDKILMTPRLFHGQWACPTTGVVNGRRLIFWGGGDGVCYAFDPTPAFEPGAKVGTLTVVWSCAVNPKLKKDADGGRGPGKNPRGMSEIIGAPVFVDNRIYVGVGHDPSRKILPGAFECIDATKTGDVTETGKIWLNDSLMKSLSTAAVTDGLVFTADLNAVLYCIDAATGQICWTYEMRGQIPGSPLVADGRVYCCDTHAHVAVLKASKEKQLLGEYALKGGQIWSTPVAANGTLYIATLQHLYALQKKAK